MAFERVAMRGGGGGGVSGGCGGGGGSGGGGGGGLMDEIPGFENMTSKGRRNSLIGIGLFGCVKVGAEVESLEGRYCPR